jgi:hypothetical protein
VYKCSCAIDAIAAKVSYSKWVDLSTVANGITIARNAEASCATSRMGAIGDAYRELRKAPKACLIRTD